MTVRVLHVLTSNQRRGAESFAFALAGALAERGHRTRPVALADCGASVTLPVPVLGRRARSPQTIARLRRQMTGADVVIAHGSTTLSACVLAGLGRETPLVYVNIGDPGHWSDTPGRRARTRWLLSRTSAVAARSERSAEKLQEILHVPAHRIRVIGNGRSAAQFPRADAAARSRARAELGVDPDARVVAYVGALSPEKRVDVVIRALGELPGYSLMLAGDGPVRAELEALAHRVAARRVVFLGNVDRPATVLAAADVIALTSDSEGLPGVLIEAGLVGRPVVATDVGFVSDIVVDGETGYLVPAGDPAATAAAIDRAYRERASLGDAGHTRCATHFDLAGVVDRWEHLLIGLASRGTRVLHVINSLKLSGGAENSITQCLPAMQPYGINSRVVALSSPAGEGAEVLRRQGVDVVETGGNSLRQLLILRREIARFRPHVVHTTLFHAGLLGRLAAASSRTPAVTSWVSTPYNERAMAAAPVRWKKLVVKHTDRLLHRRLTTAVHTLTEAAAASIAAELGVPRARVTVIPRGRDRALLGERSSARRSETRARLGIAPGVPVLLNVGRQERAKGHVGLIAAFAKIHAERPDALLLIAGRPGAASAALAEAVRDHGLNDVVRLLGQRSDVPDLLCAADVFVFSSLWEGLGCAVLEAMALELPVVSYAVPAVVEVLGDTGVVVPIGDDAALATAVLEVLRSPSAEVRGRALAARSRFDDAFTITAVAEQMATWYATFLTRSR